MIRATRPDPGPQSTSSRKQAEPYKRQDPRSHTTYSSQSTFCRARRKGFHAPGSLLFHAVVVLLSPDLSIHTPIWILKPATKRRGNLFRPTAVRAPNERSSASLVVRGVLSRTPITASANRSWPTRKRTING